MYSEQASFADLRHPVTAYWLGSWALYVVSLLCDQFIIRVRLRNDEGSWRRAGEAGKVQDDGLRRCRKGFKPFRQAMIWDQNQQTVLSAAKTMSTSLS